MNLIHNTESAIVTKPKRETPAARAARESKAYDESEKTERIWLDEDTFVDFCKTFKYLGTLISFDLRDDYDIKKRISKASQMMGMLKNVWDDVFVDKETKYLFFLAIPVNLLLWGCKTWALKAENIKGLNVFLHRSIRRILGINMQQVQDDRESPTKKLDGFFTTSQM